MFKDFTRKQLLEMDESELIKMIGEARAAGAKISGTAVVRRADGSIRYDDEKTKGKYNEGE